MIKLNVSAANIAVEEKETLTEGRVGLLCQFRFTDEWTGLAKTAVFDGADSRDVILMSDTVAIPAECLADEGYSLSVGVYGKNAAGDIVIPTVYATVGKIQRSAYPIGKETAEPTPDVVAQIQQAAANAEALARSVREDADLGKFNGGKGEKGEKGDKGNTGPAGEAGGFYTPAVTQPDANTMRVAFTPSREDMPDVEPKDITLPAGGGSGGSGEDGGYYTPAVTQPTENTMQVSFTPSKATMPAVSGKAITLPAGAKGETGSKGDKGDKGADGKSAYQYAQEGGYTGTEAEFAAKLAEEMPDKLPNPNALTFTGAVTGSYDGSAPMEVNIPSGGGDGTWKHIRKVVIPEDITTDESGVSFSERENGGYYFAFDTDENGEPFEVGELFVIYSAGSSLGTNYLADRSIVRFANRNTPNYGPGSSINIAIPISLGKTTTKIYGWAKLEKIGNYLLASGTYNSGSVFNTVYAARTPDSVSSKFTAINAYLNNNVSNGLESGSTFDFYGR